MAKVKANRLADALAMPETWQQKFKASSIKVGFQLHLSRSMLEMICALADDCWWDRATFGDIHYPDNWMSTQGSLVKRGLIQHRSEADLRKLEKKNTAVRFADTIPRCELTPAGKQLVKLLKVAGLFIEADAAIRRKQA